MVGTPGLQVLVTKGIGAEEGTRTPTPLRVHGPEPCASANSATSASGRVCAAALRATCREEQLSILQTLEPLSNTLSGMNEASQSSYCFTRFDE
jgi:hypothetical protein